MEELQAAAEAQGVTKEEFEVGQQAAAEPQGVTKEEFEVGHCAGEAERQLNFIQNCHLTGSQET